MHIERTYGGSTAPDTLYSKFKFCFGFFHLCSLQINELFELEIFCGRLEEKAVAVGVGEGGGGGLWRYTFV